MLLSLNWLKEFVKLPKDATPEDLAVRLSMHTVEVEGWQEQAAGFKGVVVGKVLETSKHPNADRLKITKVDIKEEILTIVCGAPNVAAGQLVPVATCGAVLPGGVEIKESEIRGQKSYGMICAEDELGLGSNHDGIMVLDDKAKIGEDLSAYLALNDIILEIDNKSLSNRSDLWGHYGMAREISAFYNTELQDYSSFLEPEILVGKDKLDITVESKDLCPRYSALAFTGIKIEESPEWLRKRLIAVGLKPINNIVDITNYVMLETGQPLHAFDRHLVDKIIVRRAKKGEPLETLDGKERELDEDMLVIANSHQPIAVAGVMGGQDSAISDETTEIIIEAANFEAVSIRKTSGKLALRTDASMRYEKALDPNLTETGLRRAYTLIKKICPTAVASSTVTDISNFSLNDKPILLDFSWITDKTGQEIPLTQVVNILEKLGFSVTVNDNQLSIIVPTWRAAKDVSIKEDVLEEILRIYGYDNIISYAPLAPLDPPEVLSEIFLERKIKDILAGNFNLSETYNYSFVGDSQLKKLGLDPITYLKLANPISDQQDRLRQNLIVGLLNNVRTNQFNYDELAMFEMGRVYFSTPGNFDKAGDDKERLPYQEKRIGLVLSGKAGGYFSEAKGIIQGFLNRIFKGYWEVEFVAVDDFPPYSDHEQSVRIRIDSHDLGIVSLINRQISKNFGLKNETVIAEMNFAEILALWSSCPLHKYQPIPKYPAVSRDLAFVVDSRMLYNDLEKEIKNFNPLISRVELFDSYQGGKLGQDRKSLAFHIIYQATDRTLRAEEIDVIQNSLIERLQEKFSAQIRNF